MLALWMTHAAAAGRACSRRLPRVPGWARLLWTSTALLLVLGLLSWGRGDALRVPLTDEYAARSDCERHVRRQLGRDVTVRFVAPAAGDAPAAADGGWSVHGALELQPAAAAAAVPAQRAGYRCTLRYEHGRARLAALELHGGAAHQPSRHQEQQR